jgi:uncharacterized membrane protein YGL010W
MRTLTEHLSQYARYHRDQRNILTHFAGIPLIVISVFGMLSFPVSGAVTAAMLLFLFSNFYYFVLDVKFGALMLLFSGACFALSQLLVQAFGPQWLWGSVAVFAAGWVLQFIGHYFEGKKPAFVDDLIGLLIGPLFIVAEWVFLAGFAKTLQAQIEADAGPVRR